MPELNQHFWTTLFEIKKLFELKQKTESDLKCCIQRHLVDDTITVSKPIGIQPIGTETIHWKPYWA